MEISLNKINHWVEVDRKRKVRAERRNEVFGHVRSGVRNIFIFLLLATVLVFAFSHYTEIQSVASTKIVHAVKKIPGSDKLRQSAVNYENQIDNVAK